MSMSDYYCFYQSPIGKLLLAGDAKCLRLIQFETSKTNFQPLANWQYKPENFTNAILQLAEYFAGQRKAFSIPYTLSGTTFQQNVLKQVRKIAYGKTAAYSDIAQQINNPKAARAVGMANATNVLPIIVPCHRVIGKNGVLTGFAGGLPLKQQLLDLEAQFLNS